MFSIFCLQRDDDITHDLPTFHRFVRCNDVVERQRKRHVVDEGFASSIRLIADIAASRSCAVSS
jgi:hypothetical protein